MRTAANSLAALIADASPLVIAVAAVWLFGERLVAAAIGLAGASLGTLYQKGASVDSDMLTGTFLQLIGATVTMAPVAALHGGFAFLLDATTVG